MFEILIAALAGYAVSRFLGGARAQSAATNTSGPCVGCGGGLPPVQLAPVSLDPSQALPAPPSLSAGALSLDPTLASQAAAASSVPSAQRVFLRPHVQPRFGQR